MGAGQIGGIATLLEFDFNNAAGFEGRPAVNLDGQFVMYYFSHAMLFCAGALIEPHMVLTPAVCVHGEDVEFSVYGGSHKFREDHGASRLVNNICLHRAYNHSKRWEHCPTDNIALLVLKTQFAVRHFEPNSEYILNRVRYAVSLDNLIEKKPDVKCHYFGWGSRRNGFLLPLLSELRMVEVKIDMSGRRCEDIWNTDNKYLCLVRPPCQDDLGSVVVCGGYAQGMMTSELIDRPCGVGFLNLGYYQKFLECAVDDSRDTMDLTPPSPPRTITGLEDTTPEGEETTECDDCAPTVTLPKQTTINKEVIADEILSSTPAKIGRQPYDPIDHYNLAMYEERY